MKIDTANLNPGTVFDLPDGTGTITLRVLAFEDAARIRKATVKVKAEFKNGVRYEYEDTDEEKSAELMWDACIVDWTGITDANDEPVPCTPEMKKRLMRGSPEFARMVSGMLEKLKAETEKTNEADLKN